MRQPFSRIVSAWIMALVLPALAACGAKPGNQPKKVATEVGQAGPVVPPVPGSIPGPGFSENASAIGAASQKVLVFHLSKSAVVKPGDAPELELRISPLGRGQMRVTLADFSTHGYEEQDFQLISSANHEEINADRLEAIGRDGQKLIPLGSIRFDGKKSGQLETGKVWVDFQGAESWIRDEWYYVLAQVIQPGAAPQPPVGHGPSAPAPGNGGPGHPPVQGGASIPEQPPVVEAAPRVLPIRGVVGQPVKVYPLVRNAGSHVCKAKLVLEPTQEASQYLLTLESEACGGFELNSMKTVPVKRVSSANSAYVNQDSFESLDSQWKIEFQGSGFEYVFGSGPNGTGAYDHESGTVQLNGVTYTYDTGRVLKRGQWPR